MILIFTSHKIPKTLLLSCASGMCCHTIRESSRNRWTPFHAWIESVEHGVTSASGRFLVPFKTLPWPCWDRCPWSPAQASVLDSTFQIQAYVQSSIQFRYSASPVCVRVCPIRILAMHSSSGPSSTPQLWKCMTNQSLQILYRRVRVSMPELQGQWRWVLK